MFVTSGKNISIYDISDPASPQALGAMEANVAWENEEVPTNGKVLAVASDFYSVGVPECVAARRRQDAIEATLELVAEHGLIGLTTNAVAERAGISKATMYRRWRSKDDCSSTRSTRLVSEITVPDTGSTRNDLLALMIGAVAVYSGSVKAGVMPSLVDAMSRDPELARAVREGVPGRRRAALRVVLERGVARGDLRTVIDAAGSPRRHGGRSTG